jgi:hypothetical protein
MSNFKIIWEWLLPVTSISLQYNSTVAACSEILARLALCDGRNDHNMHTTDCPHKVHTQ